MATLTVKLPAELDQRLSTTARRRGVSRSRLVREAIEQSLRAIPAGTEPTCLELARDLVGSYSGPSSLSHDRKHMKGYGR